MFKKIFVFLIVVVAAKITFGLEPEQILIIANENSPESVKIAEYYCDKRHVPRENILKLKLGKKFSDQIKRDTYNEHLAKPIRQRVAQQKVTAPIRCLLTIYGVPYKIGPRGILKGQQGNLEKLTSLANDKSQQLWKVFRRLDSISGEESPAVENFDLSSAIKALKTIEVRLRGVLKKVLAIKDEGEKQAALDKWLNVYGKVNGKGIAFKRGEQMAGIHQPLTTDDQLMAQLSYTFFNKVKKEKWDYSRKLKEDFYDRLEFSIGISGVLLRLEANINNIKGVETNASVDSELSMVMFDDYSLYRWQRNELRDKIFTEDAKTLMVSRLDGPNSAIAIGLIDKAIIAEARGLKGKAYIDTGYSLIKTNGSYGEFDKILTKAKDVIIASGQMEVTTENTAKLFAKGACPETALYCGWYSLSKYIDAFDFVDGAIGYHIASFEAVDLRNARSGQWVPSMLSDGITVTLGPVAEPYLAAFPRPNLFFASLLKGKTVVEAYYKTKPYNSWQMLLIGDPLYRPFKQKDPFAL